MEEHFSDIYNSVSFCAVFAIKLLFINVFSVREVCNFREINLQYSVS